MVRPTIRSYFGLSRFGSSFASLCAAPRRPWLRADAVGEDGRFQGEAWTATYQCAAVRWRLVSTGIVGSVFVGFFYLCILRSRQIDSSEAFAEVLPCLALAPRGLAASSQSSAECALSSRPSATWRECWVGRAGATPFAWSEFKHGLSWAHLDWQLVDSNISAGKKFALKGGSVPKCKTMKSGRE